MPQVTKLCYVEPPKDFIKEANSITSEDKADADVEDKLCKMFATVSAGTSN